MENHAPGKTYLKVTGIIYIVIAALYIISGVVLLASGGILAAAGGSAGLGGDTGAMLGAIGGAMGVVVILAGVIELVFGILGVKNCNKPEKAKTCFVLGIILVVFGALGLLGSLTGGISKIVPQLLNLAVAGCYTYGAYLNKKSVQG